MRAPSLRWQVAALVAASVAAAQALAFGVLLLWPPPEPPRMGVRQVLDALEASDAAVTAAGLRREVVDEPPPFRADAGMGITRLIRAGLAEELGQPVEAVRVAPIKGTNVPAPLPRPIAGTTTTTIVIPTAPSRSVFARPGSATPGVMVTPGTLLRSLPAALPPFEAAVRRPDGRWTVVGPREPLISPWRARVLLAFGAGALLLAPLGWWSARRLTRPVRLFAEAADRLGLDPGAPPLPVAGPAEVRDAAQAFNRMQDRLQAYMDGRTAMVAAIAHDLRTPLTSLRIRTETAPERDRMAADIARMEAMIAQVLAFVRGETVREARERLDLAMLAAACMREEVEGGAVVRWTGGDGLWIEGEPLNLRRAMHNLIQNAVAYAGSASVRVAREGRWAVVSVSDKGPGLPEAELERVFEPFARGEPSRSRATGGVGLGLASARSIARAHGGEVTLHNRAAGGLEARLSVPIALFPD